MALGIVTFALVSVVALLPIGLGSLRDSMDATMEARILRRISADMQMTPFSQVAGTTNFFDGDGEVVSATNARYRVTFQPGNGLNLPGAPAGLGDNLLRGVVSIYRVQGTNRPKIAAFPIMIARLGE